MNELGLLYRYLPSELAPPDDMWNRLVQVLDDDERNKLEKLDTLEIEPPTAAWENITLALDKLDQTKNAQAFADSFLNMEIVPPIAAWDNIQQSLDGGLPIKKIGSKLTTKRIITIGIAIAACFTGAYFLITSQLGVNTGVTKNTNQVASVNKKNGDKQSVSDIPLKNNNDSQQTQMATIIKTNNKNSSLNQQTITANQFASDSERVLNLNNYNPTPIVIINTTNNKVTAKVGKITDAFGNIIQRIKDITTSDGLIPAIGPNGNVVNVSAKLGNMIEFFQEDSVANQQEEYLDKVMRESNIWRQKFLEWRKKVDAADANPSQMNFLDPIDLMRFLQKNK